MNEIAELRDILRSLPRRQYSDLIREIDEERRRIIENQELHGKPPGEINREVLANWMGRLHYDIDRGITAVYDLSEETSPDEIRLLEVNDRMPIPELLPIVAIEYPHELEGVDYRVMVADITPNQLNSIASGKTSLPEGWHWDAARTISVDGP